MRQNSFTYNQLIDCAEGKLFGKGNAQLPMPPMLMFDRITSINEDGGIFSKGEVVAELVNDFQSAGTYNVNWNSKSLSGSQLSSGIYLYKIQAVGASGKEFVETRKMVFLK